MNLSLLSGHLMYVCLLIYILQLVGRANVLASHGLGTLVTT